ncbi:NDP-sugar synthase [Dehalogenimonas sp. 4OHTPN]|uniref:NDP-sugar synthase n=1 Tax=Dehalogenimonas sp. 4OHTPN TaxID=3166643 RepID=A0AAU8G7G2_9CHLR
MKALILVGGLGTRLRPLTINTPKAMLPVLNRPFMAHVVENLTQHGITEIIFTRGHLAGQMESYFNENYSSGVEFIFVDETQPLGTAGGIKNCQAYLDNEAFIVLNGDVYTNIDLTSMLRFHKHKGAIATIALTPVANPSAFGLVEATADGRIRRFVEKPLPEEVTTDMINAGCYILEPEVLDFIKPAANVSIEKETFQLFLKDKQPFFGWSDRTSYWIDMGSCEKYIQLVADMLSGRCACSTAPPPGVHFGEDTAVEPSARIEGHVVIGRHCRIGAGAEITGPAVIGDNCLIEDGAVISASILWDGCQLAGGSSVFDSVVAEKCCLSPGSRVSGSALADGVYVPSGAFLGNCRIWPGTIINN